MLIDFSLLNGTRRLIECDPNETIAKVLPKIVRAFQLERYRTVQLIYKGRKIAETDEIKSLGYVTGQVVIVNAQGEKPIETSSSQPETTTSSNTPADQPPAKPAVTPSSTTQQPDRPPPANNIQNLPTEPTSLSQKRPPVPLPDPEKWESNLQNLLDMGFEEDLSIRALVQAYNQPERAVELIMSDQVKEQESQPTPSQSPPDSQFPDPPTIQPTTPQSPFNMTLSDHQNANSQPELNSSGPNISSQQNSYSDIVDNIIRQRESSNNAQNNNLPAQRLPNPQPHPLPGMPVQPNYENPIQHILMPEYASRQRSSLENQILADSPPTDPTLEPDQELDMIRQLIINDPKFIDNIINIIQENTAEDGDRNNPQNQIAAQMRANPKLLMHLFGIRKTEICNVPENYTPEDVVAIRRLYELGEFTWDQVIEAYNNSEMSEELAQAFLLSLNDFD